MEGLANPLWLSQGKKATTRQVASRGIPENGRLPTAGRVIRRSRGGLKFRNMFKANFLSEP
jgi:hypothetical protein